ncbi:hypothetical protein EVAR_58463_1 [Eumeta japonica]|uniref:Secreted protein n=1 Tax=Eumeta variegata TaxID=151549 RepID=A0A4C1YQ47_EUMVA|nr:hypothetical protein EVAR_58463_1 [Eumeta japonica]
MLATEVFVSCILAYVKPSAADIATDCYGDNGHWQFRTSARLAWKAKQEPIATRQSLNKHGEEIVQVTKRPITKIRLFKLLAFTLHFFQKKQKLLFFHAYPAFGGFDRAAAELLSPPRWSGAGRRAAGDSSSRCDDGIRNASNPVIPFGGRSPALVGTSVYCRSLDYIKHANKEVLVLNRFHRRSIGKSRHFMKIFKGRCRIFASIPPPPCSGPIISF